ncbi:Uncharacterized protein OS=Vibrio parahaemolyticus GN=EN05_23100 PE=4 SV=1 [Gemmataceae bacterium]|nr:Uncharacterized protein OS=Vibrio parahaemolyticus GN=EN05_23100 PE=4 SV=1 [Gemmataceae bacterium]VTU01725.1 Uncharacterized protein OS=Vibrio parahaemolyticus GN=EN05_23100 PE=4 SV=1 [Gemmataceae bacterium]
MEWSAVEPEVAGGWGERTVADTTTHPPVIKSLHYQFDDWSGDELVTSFPCFLITARLARHLPEGLTGFKLAPVEVTKSDVFRELNPRKRLPKFHWLQVVGTAGRDDFGMSQDHLLVVSAQALAALRSGRLENCEVSRWPSGPTG